MNKNNVISGVAKECAISRASAEKVINSALGQIVRSLQQGEPVLIAGFGSFRISKRLPRSGVNPRTGKPISIEAANVPKFSAGSALKKAVNQ